MVERRSPGREWGDEYPAEKGTKGSMVERLWYTPPTTDKEGVGTVIGDPNLRREVLDPRHPPPREAPSIRLESNEGGTIVPDLLPTDSGPSTVGVSQKIVSTTPSSVQGETVVHHSSITTTVVGV